MRSMFHIILFVDPADLKITSAGIFSELNVTQMGKGPRGTDKKQAVAATYKTYEEALNAISSPRWQWLKPVYGK